MINEIQRNISQARAFLATPKLVSSEVTIARMFPGISNRKEIIRGLIDKGMPKHLLNYLNSYGNGNTKADYEYLREACAVYAAKIDVNMAKTVGGDPTVAIKEKAEYFSKSRGFNYLSIGLDKQIKRPAKIKSCKIK